ncbi:hypothetical protein HNY73_004922 [Argiope bruennichi]|uniref:Uncharacterized protein n=1 Tax=Argiope bruennichi TaxID=94029 RepID=A0A8T0FX85_ARGBR|nr:hypothetical protein HNY73_004922 [Argiope bruennichi]
MQERCVIWAENHDSRNCPQKKAETVKKKCANCGGPHTASYQGCLKFPKLNINRNGEIQQGKSFASLFKKSNIPPTSAPSKAPAMSTPPNATEPPIQLSKNNQDFEDTFKLLNHLKTITVAIPNLKEILQKLYKEKNPLNKLFNLAEAFSPTSCMVKTRSQTTMADSGNGELLALLAEMKKFMEAGQEEMKKRQDEMKQGQERMEQEMRSGRERMEKMKAVLEKEMSSGQERMEQMTAGLEKKLESGLKKLLEEMKARRSELQKDLSSMKEALEDQHFGE